MERHFPFAGPSLVAAAFGRGWWPEAVLDDDALRIRFGPWRMDVPRSEILGAEVTGPYSLLKVLGVRLSLADRGLTFGTDATAGVCVRFTHPRRGVDPLGLLRHPAVTLTVADYEGLASALTSPAHTDLRTGTPKP